MPARCPKGKINRKGYVTKTGKRVKGGCIKDRGLPGKTKKKDRVIPKLAKGTLGQFGYHGIKNLSVDQRRTALKKAIRAKGATYVLRKVNAIYILQRNQNPKVASKLNADKKWIQKTYFKK